MCTVGGVLFLCQPVLLHKHHSAQLCDATWSTATTLQPLCRNNTQVLATVSASTHAQWCTSIHQFCTSGTHNHYIVKWHRHWSTRFSFWCTIFPVQPCMYVHACSCTYVNYTMYTYHVMWMLCTVYSSHCRPSLCCYHHDITMTSLPLLPLPGHLWLCWKAGHVRLASRRQCFTTWPSYPPSWTS